MRATSRTESRLPSRTMLLSSRVSLLMVRTLRMRLNESAVNAALLDEAMAYQLVWPD